MKTKRPLKISIFLIGLLTLLLPVSNLSYSVVLNDNVNQENQLIAEETVTPGQERQEQAPQYVPGEVLVKFKEGVDPESVLRAINLEATGIARVHSIRPAVAKFRKSYELEKDKDGWYWFRGRNYKEINDIPDEELFEEVYKQMSPKERSLYRTYKLTLPEGKSVKQVIAELEKNPAIEYAEPNYIMEIQMIPDDPYYHTSGSWGQPYDDLWGIKKIQCEQAWEISQGEGIIVAVIDTGADYNHPDLWNNIWVNSAVVPDRNGDGKIDLNDCDLNGNYIIEPNEIVNNMWGWDFTNNDNDPMDGHGHGTHVSGTIAAVGNNNIGVIGVAPNAKIMAIRGLDDSGSGYISTLAACVTFAADNDAKILSNSWGGQGTSVTLADAFLYAYSKGCVAIAAAGNNSADAADFTPANIETIIAVAATDPYGSVAWFSNYGLCVPVAAPGVDVLSLRATGTDMYGDGTHIVGGVYYRANGTSMACPHVSGLAALIMARYPHYNNDQIGWLIKNSVDVISDKMGIFPPGFGIINALNSLTNPTIPPRLHTAITIYQINYDLDNIPIYYDVEGEDLWQYTIQYKKAEETDWHDLFGPSSVPGRQEFIWDLSNIKDGAYQILLSATTIDGRQETAYASIDINRVTYYKIYPETIFIVHWSTRNDESVQGLYRLGGNVPLVGRAFGEYHLEWRKAEEGSEWRSDYFNYEVSAGYLGIWDTSLIKDEGVYYVRLVDNLDVERFTEIMLSRNVKEGYPVTLSPLDANGRIDSSTLGSKLADIDNDGELEIITVRNYIYPAQIYIFESDGRIKAHWEVSGQYGNSAYPALADMDGDGIDEILITTTARTSPGSGIYQETIYCFKVDGTLLFRRALPPSTESSRAVYMRDPLIVMDLNSDSIPEVIYRHDNALYLLNNHGQDFSLAWPKNLEVGWPFDIADTNYMSIGNFDDGDDLEIVIVQNEGFIRNVDAGHLNIYVFKLDGSSVSGWPKTIENAYSKNKIVCGDMDGDGYDDIVVATNHDIGGALLRDQTIYGFRSDGTELFVSYLPNYYRLFYSYFLFADLNNDNRGDLIFNNLTTESISKIEVLNYAGQSFAMWPFTYPDQDFYKQPFLMPRLAVDIDGDNEVEIVGVSIQTKRPAGMPSDPTLTWYSTYHLMILNANGEMEISNPLNDVILPPVTSMALHYYDIDKDGHGELVIEGSLPVRIGDNYWNYRPCILVYDTNTNFNPELSQWPTPHHDKSNTNRWCKIKGANRPPVLDLIGNKTIDENQTLNFIITAVDPDGTTLSYPVPDLPQGAIFTDNNDGTASFTWTPTYDQAGDYQVTFTVSDGIESDSETITITVVDVHEYTVSLWGSIRDYSTIKIYGDGRIKIIMSDGRVIEGLLGEYLYDAGSNAYWKIYIRGDFSLERFEIYQQQGNNKVLLAKLFYDNGNRIIADMSACPSPVRIGIKDYNNHSKTIFDIYAINPTQVLIELTMDNLGNYLHTGKTVYLYDAGQIFENIPLFASTDPQRLADQPIITLYYQNGENNTITSWRYKDVPESIFVVNNNVDILGLLTNIPDRNPATINDIIQNGDDIRIICEQMISLPTRDVRASFDSYTGILRFYDATTYEIVAEVKYPEFNGVAIDDIEYEIVIADGVITLRPVNNPPDISQIPDSITKDEGDIIKAEEIELAVDLDGDTLTYTYSGWIDSLPYIIGYEDQGEHILHVEVSDGTESVGKDITIKVNNVNRPPYVEPIGNQEINENQTLGIIVTATDPDGDSLTYSAWDLPAGSTFNPDTRTFSWTPTYDQAGYYKAFFEASDGNLSMNVGIPITVNNVNRAPYIEPVLDQVIKEGEQWSFQLKAVDPDGDKLLYTFNNWDISLKGLELSPDGLLTWRPNYLQAGEYTLDLIVSDYPDHPDDYIKTYFNVTILVIEVTDPPKILYLRTIGPPGRVYRFLWLGWDEDDGYRLNYSYRVDEGRWSAPTRRRSVSMKEIEEGLKPGVHLFQVKAIDSHGAESDVKSVEFTVEENQPPRILYLRHFKTPRGMFFIWRGYDKEDGYEITYSYRIDEQKWSEPST